MKSFARFSILLLLGVNANEDSTETAFRILRGGGNGGGYGGGRGGGRGGEPDEGRHEGGHHGHYGNHTWGNRTDDRTEWLNQTCTDNGIVCSDVSADVLANCTNFTSYGHHGHGWDRDLLVVDEAVQLENEDALVELHELNNIPSVELRGSVDRGLKGRHGNKGRHQDGSGHDGNRWGNLTDAELEEMRLNHLTCKCCMDYSD
ncbi:hypothetical protein ACHAW6_011107 [Cyclotella cf. meneghiniana]